MNSKADKIVKQESLAEKAPAPFLRWAGGKRKLVPVITSMFPKNFDGKTQRFHEPFVGGGSLMLALGDKSSNFYVPGKNLFINDSNPDLIDTYIAIRDTPDELIKELKKLANDLSKSAFEEIRSQLYSNSIKRAARFIYLNKTCFNGLWRVNSKGEFNVPWGQIKNPLICDEPNIRAISERLQKSTITNTTFSSAINAVKGGDIVYFDPPYIPLTKSASFASYAKEGFGIMDQYALSGSINGLTDLGALVLLSNSDTPETREIFSSLYLYQLDVTRSISANSSSRMKVKEILASNSRIPDSKLHPVLTRIQ